MHPVALDRAWLRLHGSIWFWLFEVVATVAGAVVLQTVTQNPWLAILGALVGALFAIVVAFLVSVLVPAEQDEEAEGGTTSPKGNFEAGLDASGAQVHAGRDVLQAGHDIHYHGASGNSPPSPAPPGIRVFIAPSRPPNWAHVTVANEGASDEFTCKAVLTNTYEPESPYEVPWRKIGYPVTARINQGDSLDLNLASADESDQNPSDSIEAHDQVRAAKRWKVPDLPATKVARVRLCSPSVDVGYFSRWVPVRYSLGVRLTISGQQLRAVTYLLELLPDSTGNLGVVIDEADFFPTELVAHFIKTGKELVLLSRDPEMSNQAAMDALVDWRAGLREVIGRRLDVGFVGRLDSHHIDPDHSWTRVSMSQERIAEVDGVAADIDCLNRFLADSRR